MKRLAWLVPLLASLAAAQPPAPAPRAGSAPAIEVSGNVPTPRSLSGRDLAALPRTTVDAVDRAGRTARYEGVALGEILARAGAPMGEALRGRALASVVVVEAADGYRAAFALPELDPVFTDARIIVADRRDGGPLDASEGPFRLVVPGDKRPARWVRQVTAIRLVTAP